MRNGKKVESVLIIYGNVRLLVYTTKVKSTAGESRFHDFAKRTLKEFAREKFTNERVLLSRRLF